MCSSDWQADYWQWSGALSDVTRGRGGWPVQTPFPPRPPTPLTQLDWSSIKPSPGRMMDRCNCFLLPSQPINVEWLHFSSSAGATNLISGGSGGWRQCQIAGHHLLYAGAQFGTTRATTPNVVCGEGQAGPGGDATATATDRRVTVATTTSVPATDGPPAPRAERRGRRREIALRRVKTRAQRLNYSTADQWPATGLLPPSILSKQVRQTITTDQPECLVTIRTPAVLFVVGGQIND